jgi:hypothetical protein
MHAQLVSTSARGAAASNSSTHLNVRDPDAVARMSRELGITWLQLLRIVDRVGTSRHSIRSAVLTDLGVTWH